MDVLVAKTVSPGDFECVSTEDLEEALERAKTMHFIIFFILMYIRIHTPLWSRIIYWFRWNKKCCFDGEEKKIILCKELEHI